MAVACAMGLACVGTGLAATQASASVPVSPLTYSWQKTFDNIQYGWVHTYYKANEYAWAQASYATLDHFGGGEAATLACDAYFHNALLARGCKAIAEGVVDHVISGFPRYIYHGIWIRWYPYQSRHLYWGRY